MSNNTMSPTPATSPTPALSGLEFIGHWIGETMVAGLSAVAGPSAAESPAHIWEIHRSNNTLIIHTRWEHETVPGGYFSALVPTDTPAFELQTETHLFVVTLVDSQHFIIRNWDTNDVRGGKGAHLDVVFSRLGVAELQAQAVWRQHKDALPKAKRLRKSARAQDDTHHWRQWKRAANRVVANTVPSIGAAVGERAAQSS